MKKNVKIIISTCVLVLWGMQAIKSYAAMTEDAVDQYVEVYVAEYDESIKICNKEILYNEEEEETAILYQLFPEGYIVIEPDDYRIIEYSWSVDYPFIEDEINYYNGPLQYYFKTTEMFQHSRTGSFIDVDGYKEIRLSYESQEKNIETDDTISMLSARSSSYSLTTALRTFDYNPDGRCGSVAAAILFAYYEDAIDSAMVSSYLLSDSTGKIFTDYLKPHIEDLDGETGSSTSDLVSGMGWYISNVGLYNTYSVLSANNPQYVTCVNCINVGRPVIVDLNEHPTYNEHWVVGYGYQYNQTSDENTSFVLVNDGWGNNGIYINWSYIGDLVYLNKPEW